jgi:uncharacterized BrkB/YihY/UPF0761 family membrane protein
MNIKEKWESLDPTVKTKVVRWVGYPLLFLIFIIPGLIYWSIPSLYNDGRHEWMMWWTIVTASTFVAIGIGYFVIYKNIKEAIELKKWRKEHPAPKQ